MSLLRRFGTPALRSAEAATAQASNPKMYDGMGKGYLNVAKFHSWSFQRLGISTAVGALCMVAYKGYCINYVNNDRKVLPVYEAISAEAWRQRRAAAAEEASSE